jgi:hypothetical protein
MMAFMQLALSIYSTEELTAIRDAELTRDPESADAQAIQGILDTREAGEYAVAQDGCHSRGARYPAQVAGRRVPAM